MASGATLKMRAIPGPTQEAEVREEALPADSPKRRRNRPHPTQKNGART